MVDLKQRRIELGMTMLEVAKKVGVSEATISRYESGNIRNMRSNRIAKYAQVLQVPYSDFVDEKMINEIAPIKYDRSDVIKRINDLPDEQFEKFATKVEGYLDGLEDQ